MNRTKRVLHRRLKDSMRFLVLFCFVFLFLESFNNLDSTNELESRGLKQFCSLLLGLYDIIAVSRKERTSDKQSILTLISLLRSR